MFHAAIFSLQKLFHRSFQLGALVALTAPWGGPVARAADATRPRVIRSFDKPYPTFGKIVRKDPRFDKLLPADAKLEKLAEGFAWSEGPIWIKSGGFVLFPTSPTTPSANGKTEKA